MIIPNEDQRSKDYGHNVDVFRPSHADYTYAKPNTVSAIIVAAAVHQPVKPRHV
jgi:chorismate synthase